MNFPRAAAIVSGVAASTAAFIVVSNWNLAGTVAGAALFPVVYILVSHGSTQGVETVTAWMRLRRGDGDQPASGGAAAAPVAKDAGAAGRNGATTYATSAAGAADAGSSAAAGRSSRPWSHARNQWVLAGLACVALGLSLYGLVASDAAGTTVVRERVIETVTVTIEGDGATAKLDKPSSGGTTATTEASPDTTVTTTATTETSAPPSTEPPSTTATSGAGGSEAPSSPADSSTPAQ